MRGRFVKSKHSLARFFWNMGSGPLPPTVHPLNLIRVAEFSLFTFHLSGEAQIPRNTLFIDLALVNLNELLLALVLR